MNIIALTGNATKDIELTYTQSGTAVGKGSIAVRRDFKNKQTGEYETDFINFTAFGKTAEIMANYIHKGDKFGINGRLQIDVFDGQDGQRKYFTNVVVNGFDFPDKKKEQPSNNFNQQPQQPQQPQQGFGNNIPVENSDLPF